MTATQRNQKQEKKKNANETIKIEYDNSEDAMYGQNGSDGYDATASEAKFEKMLMAELKKNYPDNEIEISTGYGKYSVDGDTGHDEIPWIEEIIHQVWSTFEWLVQA